MVKYFSRREYISIEQINFRLGFPRRRLTLYCFSIFCIYPLWGSFLITIFGSIDFNPRSTELTPKPTGNCFAHDIILSRTQ